MIFIKPVKCVADPEEVWMKTEQEIINYFNADKLFRRLDDKTFTKKSNIMGFLRVREITIIYNLGKSQLKLEQK